MALLDNPTVVGIGASYTAAAGTDRIVVFCTAQEKATSTNPVLTFGGQTAELIVNTSGNQYCTALFIIREADIPAGTHAPTLVDDEGVSRTEFMANTLSGIDQTTPVLPGSLTTQAFNASTASGTVTTDNSDTFVFIGGRLTRDINPATVTGDLALGAAYAGAYAMNSLEASAVAGPSASWSAGFNGGSQDGAYITVSFTPLAVGPDYTSRKGSTLDNVTHGLGTITTATLNAVSVFDHVSSQAAGTVSFTGAITDEITTSGEYDLVLGDGVGTETYTVQVNVYGVAPSNNPLQKDGSALASLTGVQLRVTDGANLNGTELYYSGTGTTDVSGNLGNIDLSSTSAADTDPVLLHMRTSAGDSIIASETVGLI